MKKKAGAITSTPNRNSAKRRSSLPNGEGLQLKENSVSPSFTPLSGEKEPHTLALLWNVQSGREKSHGPSVPGVLGLGSGHHTHSKGDTWS